MKRGIVFHDENGDLKLAVLNADGSFTETDIDDQEKLYDDLPRTRGDIVDVEDNEALGIFTLRSLYTLNFYRHEVEVPAYEAIRHGMLVEPKAMALAISGPEVNEGPTKPRILKKQ